MKKTYFRPETEIESMALESNFLEMFVSITGGGPSGPGGGGGGSGNADSNINKLWEDEDEEIEPKWDTL
ncbi:MAG: hypothetical protein II674_05525 [Prevotella sp.]|nr:hypothetical protein [Prevotella sp.]